jgi:hypothetical protein
MSLDPARTAERLMGRAPDSVESQTGGGNNRLYRVRFGAQSLALKYYPQDGRNRLGAEFDALDFLVRHGMDQVPRPIAADSAANAALYEWIEGERPSDLGDAQTLDQVFGFITSLLALADTADAARLAPASAACLSHGAAFEQFRQRLDRLRPHAGPTAPLRHFLDQALVPSFERLERRYLEHLERQGLGPHSPLDRASLVLSPSDFGRHNCLRRSDGRLVFLDFEYFGWDDPVKFTSDFALHPGSDFAPPLRAAIIERAKSLFQARDAGFAARQDALLGVFGLIWCLIMLNEFIPEVWERRAQAGSTLSRDAAQAVQLDKARRLLAWVDELR